MLPPTVTLQLGQRQGVVATAYDARGHVLPTVRIACSSDRDGNCNIYLMNPDGSNQRQFTRAASPETSPEWLAGGQREGWADVVERRHVSGGGRA